MEYPKRSLSPREMEESPDSIGQGAGEIPVGANPRKVPQKHTALCSKIGLNFRAQGKGEKVR